MKKYHPEAPKGYIFIGNGGKDHPYIKNLDCLFLQPVYDITGKVIKSSNYFAIFVSKKDYDKYDEIMMNEMRKARKGIF